MLAACRSGTEVAARIAAAVGGAYEKAISADEVKAVVATEVEQVLAAVRKAAGDRRRAQTFCRAVVGVNASANHHHRQARLQISAPRAQGDAGRRATLPRRCVDR